MSDRPRAGAKAVVWDWEYLSNYSDSVYCLELTERETAFLLTVFTQALWSTRWLNRPVDFEDIESFVVNVQNKLMTIQPCNGGNGEITETIYESVVEYVGGLIIEIEENEEMGRLTIESIQGVSYLVDDCGCGTLKRYKLTPVEADPVTGAIGSAIDSIPDQTLVVDPGIAQSCYYTKAAELIVKAMSEFISSVAGWYITGTLSVTGLTIGIEAAQILSALLSGNVQINPASIGLTPEEVSAALATQGYQQWLAEKLEERGLSGNLNRWNVLRLTQGLPSQFSFPTPVEPYTSAWGYYSNLQSLNNQLSYAATGCKTGQSSSFGNCWEIDLTTAPTFEATGLTFHVGTVGNWGTFVAGEGIKPVDDGQWQIWVYYDGLPASIVQQIYFKFKDVGSQGGFARVILSNGEGFSGSSVNISGNYEGWVNSGGTIETINAGYGWYFNQLVSNAVLEKIGIQFSTTVQAAPQMSTVACPE